MRFKIEVLLNLCHEKGSSMAFDHEKGANYSPERRRVQLGDLRYNVDEFSKGNSRLTWSSKHFGLFGGELISPPEDFYKVPQLQVNLRELFNKHFVKGIKKNVTQPTIVVFDKYMEELSKSGLELDVVTAQNNNFVLPKDYEDITRILSSSKYF